ncbi:MAG TPA: retroviral-like aspartic protease family protein [Candidatus Binatia bacterium]|nr:retroviral-like aspartic protease family protein [Candidatus Binatia bacterium]
MHKKVSPSEIRLDVIGSTSEISSRPLWKKSKNGLAALIVIVLILARPYGAYTEADSTRGFTVKANDLRVLSAPDEFSQVLTTLQKGDDFFPIGDSLGAGGQKWYLVKTKKGTVGWIRSTEAEESKKLADFFSKLPTSEASSLAPIEIPSLPSSPSLPGKSITVPLEMSGSLAIVQVVLNRSLKAYMAIDTGATTTLISRRIATTLRLNLLGSRIAIATANGTITAPLARLGSVKVGEAEVYNLIVPVHDFSFNSRVEGLLGLDFLKQFHVSIDSRRQLLILAPR